MSDLYWANKRIEQAGLRGLVERNPDLPVLVERLTPRIEKLEDELWWWDNSPASVWLSYRPVHAGLVLGFGAAIVGLILFSVVGS